MSDTAGSFGNFSLHVGARFMIRCSTYTDTTPILTIDAGDTTWAISPTGQDATDEALEFARELVCKAQKFAAEIERMHAAQHPGTTDGGTAATSKADESKAA